MNEYKTRVNIHFIHHLHFVSYSERQGLLDYIQSHYLNLRQITTAGCVIEFMTSDIKWDFLFNQKDFKNHVEKQIQFCFNWSLKTFTFLLDNFKDFFISQIIFYIQMSTFQGINQRSILFHRLFTPIELNFFFNEILFWSVYATCKKRRKSYSPTVVFWIRASIANVVENFTMIYVTTQTLIWIFDDYMYVIETLWNSKILVKKWFIIHFNLVVLSIGKLHLNMYRSTANSSVRCIVDHLTMHPG